MKTKALATLLLSVVFSLPAHAWFCDSPDPTYPTHINPKAQMFLSYFERAKGDGSFYLGDCEIEITLIPKCSDLGKGSVEAVDIDARVTNRFKEYNYYSRNLMTRVNLASGAVSTRGESEEFRYSFSKKDGLDLLDVSFVSVNRHYFGANRYKYRFQFKTDAAGELREAFWRMGYFIPFIYDQSVSCK